MSTLSISLPDELEITMGCASQEETFRELKLLLAIKLFETGRASSGQAAEIAGLSKRNFLLTLSMYGVPCVSWDDEELLAEAAAL